MQFKLTWAAIVAALVFLVPSVIVGGYVSLIYKWFLSNLVSPGFFASILYTWFPGFLHGSIGGIGAIGGAYAIFKRADYNVVCYSFSSIVVFVLVFSSLAVITFRHIPLSEAILIASQTVGIVAGAFIMLEPVQKKQEYRFNIVNSTQNNQ